MEKRSSGKVLKPLDTYEHVRDNAVAEFEKLRHLRNPYITFVFDAFEYRDTFYIITERCYCPVSDIFALPNFDGKLWIMPIARCLLQAVHYLHIHDYVHQDIHAGNVFAALVKNEMAPTDPSSVVTQFKLADLGIAKLRDQVSATNTRALWMLPPEVLDEAQFGPIDSRVDIYHVGLLFLQFALSTQLTFTREEILAGKPREQALSLPAPFNFALKKLCAGMCNTGRQPPWNCGATCMDRNNLPHNEAIWAIRRFRPKLTLRSLNPRLKQQTLGLR